MNHYSNNNCHRTAIIVLLAVLTCPALRVAAQALTQQQIDARVSALMARMTLDEKIGQLNIEVAGDITTGLPMTSNVTDKIARGQMGAVFNLKGADQIRELQRLAVERSRLGIPLIVGMDVIHGYETIFPIPTALACSWDMDAIQRSAHIAAREASADGICLTFSPMVDVCIDPRWGRISEGSCEDPYLMGQVASAMVRGYQGDLSQTDNILSCVKHFALYGASEAGKDYNTVDMSRVRMYNRYFPPYRAAVDAGAACVMPSFNVVDGIPATSNRWLLTDVLRRQWGFKGLTISDYGAVGEMVSHGMGDIATCAWQALNAGTDMDMCTASYIGTLADAVHQGHISEAQIDEACRHVLEAKCRLGLLDDPYKYCDSSRHDRDVYTAENRQAARDIAAETFVLLKNKGNLLPLAKQGKIALIGPLAGTRNNIVGAWVVAFTPERYSTLREAMERAVDGKAQVLYSQGCNITSDSALQVAAEFGKTIPRIDAQAARREALAIAEQADVIVCAMGETADMSGECACRTNLDMPDEQRALLQDLVKLGKPIVLLNFSGRPTTLGWENDHVDAILNVWFGGSEAGDAICDVLFGDKVPSGKLAMTMPQSVGQIPIYYNHLNTGRPVPDGTKEFRKYQSNYLDIRNDPLFPFGFGLSYTTFSYGAPTLSQSILGEGETVTVTVPVTNTGNWDADEVVQLYIRDLVATISRPVKELKGFERIHLKRGETKQVRFTLDRDALSYYDGQGTLRLEPGEVHVMTGPNSSDLQTVSLMVK